MSKIYRAVAVASVAIVVLIGVLAAPASAGKREYDVAKNPGRNNCPAHTLLQNAYERGKGILATGCFGHNGDIFWIRDDRKDGRSAGIVWRVEGKKRGTIARAGVCRNKAGKHSAGMKYLRCNKNFPENRRIWYKIGACNKTANRSCRLRKHYRNKFLSPVVVTNTARIRP